MNSSIPIFKIVVLGEGRVGKTSMTLKYTRDQFNEDQESSINASYLEKVEKLNNGQQVKLAIWDTAGQEKYNAIAPVYYRDAISAIIVYDITMSESFQKVKKWVLQLKQYANKDILLTIVGNKCDMENQRKVSHKEAEAFARQYKADHFIVSAKNGKGIEELFKNVVERIYAANNEKGELKTNKRRNPRIKIDSKDQTTTKGKCDC